MRLHNSRTAAMLHACAGILCPVHLDCARWAFVDGTSEPSATWLPNCAPPQEVQRPGFIDLHFVGPPAPHQYQLRRFTRSPATSNRRPMFT